MNQLREFLEVAKAENVQSVRFKIDGGNVDVVLEATINDRRYESAERGPLAELENVAKSALYQWAEGMKTAPPPPDVPKPPTGDKCSQCGVNPPTTSSPAGVCSDTNCIQAHWRNMATLRRNFKG